MVLVLHLYTLAKKLLYEYDAYNNNNNSGHLIDALHKKYHSALQKGNKLYYFSCANHNTLL